ncbi:Nucleotidylyl transferase [Microthyrium microscopicum]|uniref:Nucleotidylyl transferase n=1 Tax=Microthyrium microscopicum TaxID=703497 RepID=A0A6A6TVB3_9PEZI|nr:Nucleotidylyl transferase [Microthyrium microscopicum]
MGDAESDSYSVNMKARVGQLARLLPTLESSVQTFVNSKSNFTRIATNDSQSPWPGFASGETRSQEQIQNARKLFILDSSYNPPSKAHAALALSALHSVSSTESTRLLLLFGVSNADKGFKPAAFHHRLAMMILFAQDLRERSKNFEFADIPIDIGLTSAAYYTDKSPAISESGVYADECTHVHMIGYDTLIRFLNPKYYEKFDPPLSALDPYFDAGHQIRVLLRANEDGNDEQELKAQKAYITKLAVADSTSRELGFKREWAQQIVSMEDIHAAGISSTRIREAVFLHKWEAVERLVTPGVFAWLHQHHIYDEPT